MLTPRMDMNHPIFGFAHGWAEELKNYITSLVEEDFSMEEMYDLLKG